LKDLPDRKPSSVGRLFVGFAEGGEEARSPFSRQMPRRACAAKASVE